MVEGTLMWIFLYFVFKWDISHFENIKKKMEDEKQKAKKETEQQKLDKMKSKEDLMFELEELSRQEANKKLAIRTGSKRSKL